MTKKLRITVDGKTYQVEVEVLGESAPRPATPPAAAVSAAVVAAPAPLAAPKPSAAPGAGAGDLPSPLAGKVVSIHCAVGQTVAEGEKVMTLEAMKMNTFVTAPTGGTVKAIRVNPGDAVEEGQPLLTLG